MRSVYIGTSEFAAAVLRRLHFSPYRPSLVVTRPDSPQGRGRRLQPPPAAIMAAELGTEVYQPKSLNTDEARARIAAHEPDVLCVCAYGALIREPLLSEYWILNVHPSLLPRWRGAAPIERAVLAGDRHTGVSIMVLTAGLDSGPVCAQEAVEILPDDDYGTLARRLEELGGELLVRVLTERPECAEQSDEGVTYAEKLTGADRLLDPARPAAELARRVRALHPHIGAYVELPGGERLGVVRARVVEDTALAPGELAMEPPRPVLGCASQALELLVVQPPGKRAMDSTDYLRGRRR